jgi:hypothetical protein
VEAFAANRGRKVKVEHLKHLGFYKVVYDMDIFEQRPEIGAVGGSLIGRNGKIAGGLMNNQGEVIYEGLRRGFSGYMNRAALVQEAQLLDTRCMRINPACKALVRECMKEINIEKRNEKVCSILKEAGYKLIWNPEAVKKI